MLREFLYALFGGKPARRHLRDLNASLRRSQASTDLVIDAVDEMMTRDTLEMLARHRKNRMPDKELMAILLG